MDSMFNTSAVVLHQTIIAETPPIQDAVILGSQPASERTINRLRYAQRVIESMWYGTFPEVIIEEPVEGISDRDSIHLFEKVFLLRPSGFAALENADYTLMNRFFFELNCEEPLTFKYETSEDYKAFHKERTFIAAFVRQ